MAKQEALTMTEYGRLEKEEEERLGFEDAEELARVENADDIAAESLVPSFRIH